MLSFIITRRDYFLLKIIKGTLVDLPSPIKISYLWKFGSVLGFIFLVQFISGIFLSFFYSSDSFSSFSSIDLLNRDLVFGWVVRNIHLAGAGGFFLFIYLHIGRNIYFLVFIHKPQVWNSGVIIYILSMAIAFLGYVLPWGQMSYWGATVITNFFSVIPLYGNSLVIWIWGGFAVDYPTLSRFFGLHFLLPFILLFFILLHIFFLHSKGSSNPLGQRVGSDTISFFPLFLVKDILGWSLVFLVIYYYFFFDPDLFIELEKYIEANPLVTPIHIQPEWYFLSAYAILRSVPKKLGGVLGLVRSILVLLIFPYLVSSNFSSHSKKLNSQTIFWFFISKFILLTWCGACPVEDPYILIRRISSVCFFVWFGFIGFYSYYLRFNVPKI